LEVRYKILYFRTNMKDLINKKQTTMKKILTLTLVGMLLSLAMTACGSSKGGHCDAYGSVNQVENSDLASK
jgi:hypothetical protein